MEDSHQFMFALDDRSEMGTDVLLNRFAMRTMNVMVDPQKKYILTTEGDIFDESWKIMLVRKLCNKKTQ